MLQGPVYYPKPIVRLLGLVLLCSLRSVFASEKVDQAALYAIAVETSMPHLEENLRYTKTVSTKCLTTSELLVAFPVLAEDTFDDCRLLKQAQSDTHASYRLDCPTSTGTTGNAAWQFNASQFAGTLEVKLGGKNMTFHQRVAAKRVGECPAAKLK